MTAFQRERLRAGSAELLSTGLTAHTAEAAAAAPALLSSYCCMQPNKRYYLSGSQRRSRLLNPPPRVPLFTVILCVSPRPCTY